MLGNSEQNGFDDMQEAFWLLLSLLGLGDISSGQTHCIVICSVSVPATENILTGLRRHA